ncbi:Hsp33 family molecular chaperone HslO [Anaerosalibacter bizertensis]|uniref:33 kDa chaperonin n=2 Tax=Bacillota TaxID=1239 RepID=A0A844FIP0_9FIRM|nr:Hsp33 family molecular chaperone HslO [Anaerosalibacter bizertensis]MBV1820169.1 Hsp33 family molecular chaperone HslO [Bacteroidales bacterium MSK.15.36]MBU5294178.1 Hsp33 family molecular chaperone HslO [Anaerosalibacter bizertensis]MCB5560449.1 Hsp33 family molecular chaperone HslO [Anaerosalibacter bizertensis]MCG4565962.1 Hsp33 family molecular chaperone HslO [Anaerosalibacter bizertensis]MCG4583360.1 Hsp33 family molecular chaperone HslO [Anaerosalibacter bizertensis]
MKDYVIRAIDEKGTIRVFVASTTNLVEEARKTHNTMPTGTAALGRTLTAASIMGTMMKNEKESISIQFRGDGPIKNIAVVSNSKGEVKGYLGDPTVDLPLKSNGKLDVGGAVGRNGRVIVIKDFGLKDPYIGQSSIVSGEIAEDLTYYFANSEQQPSAVNLGVLVDRDLSVKAAGGYIVQLLPGTLDEDIDKLEECIKNSEPISTLIDKGLTPEEILENVFGKFNMNILDRKEVSFKCNCSRDKIETTLRSLGEKEIKSMIEEDGKAEVICHFCNEKYNFSKEDLKSLL